MTTEFIVKRNMLLLWSEMNSVFNLFIVMVIFAMRRRRYHWRLSGFCLVQLGPGYNLSMIDLTYENLPIFSLFDPTVLIALFDSSIYFSSISNQKHNNEMAYFSLFNLHQSTFTRLPIYYVRWTTKTHFLLRNAISSAVFIGKMSFYRVNLLFVSDKYHVKYIWLANVIRNVDIQSE